MTAAPLPTFTCRDCGDVFARKVRGATPQRCESCQRAAYKGGVGRGARSGTEPGPILQAREIVGRSEPKLRARITAAALSVTIGMPEDFAASIVNAIDTLLMQGETPREIRVRLNPHPSRATPTRLVGGDVVEAAWRALLYEDDLDDDEEAAS